jgi:hypothetical protein
LERSNIVRDDLTTLERPTKVQTVGFEFPDGTYRVASLAEGTLILVDGEGGFHAAQYDPAPEGARIFSLAPGAAASRTMR